MAELADAPDLGSGVNSCRFDSCYPHHISTARLIKSAVEIFSLKSLDLQEVSPFFAHKNNRYGVKSIAVFLVLWAFSPFGYRVNDKFMGKR